MKITASQLRRIIREEVAVLYHISHKDKAKIDTYKDEKRAREEYEKLNPTRGPDTGVTLTRKNPDGKIDTWTSSGIWSNEFPEVREGKKMKIRLGDLRTLIKESYEQEQRSKLGIPSLKEIEAKSGEYSAAYADLVEFIQNWGGGEYEETGPNDPFPGALRQKSFKAEPFPTSSAFNSLNPFEKYCLLLGTDRHSPECAAVLGAVDAQYGAKITSGKKFLTSVDHMQLSNAILGSEYEPGTDYALGKKAYEVAKYFADNVRKQEADKAKKRADMDAKNAAARAKRAAAKSRM